MHYVLHHMSFLSSALLMARANKYKQDDLDSVCLCFQIRDLEIRLPMHNILHLPLNTYCTQVFTRTESLPCIIGVCMIFISTD